MRCLQVFDAATGEVAAGAAGTADSRWKPVQHETSYFDTLRDSFAFPAPSDASYTTDGPRTVHSIDQCKYYEVESAQRGWHNFSDFHAKYILLPAHNSSQGCWNRAVTIHTARGTAAQSGPTGAVYWVCTSISLASASVGARQPRGHVACTPSAG